MLSKQNLGIVVCGLVGSASIGSAATSPYNFSTLDPYTQSFDALSTTGTTNAFPPGPVTSSSPGNFYVTTSKAAITTYRADAGTGTTGTLYSYGTGTSTERALGSVASGTPGNISYGALFYNNTGVALSGFSVTYNGEQWRNGGNVNVQSLTVGSGIASYDTATSTMTLMSEIPGPAGLTFSSPIHTATAGALDGNAAANRAALSGTVSQAVAAGQYFYLQFDDLDDTGSDHGLAVDDLTLTPIADTSSMPEPASAALSLLAMTPFLHRRRTLTHVECADMLPKAFKQLLGNKFTLKTIA